MVEITYIKDRTSFDAVSSDENIEITSVEKNGRNTVSVKALSDITFKRARIPLGASFDDEDLILANGYQSWTQTEEFTAKEHLNNLDRLPKAINARYHFKAYGSQYFISMAAYELLGFDFSYVKGKAPFFIGSFNFRNAYLIIRFLRKTNMILLESDIDGRELKKGDSFTVFDYMTAEDGKEYFNSFHPVSSKKLFGYTSWYNHYQNISWDKINAALEKADERFDLFQIDDGFETFVGDWLDVDNEKFPDGLADIIDRIHEKGMLAGIWLAPLVAETDSRVMKEHPDWIARKNGEPVYAGSNWSGFCPLDLNNSEAVSYIKKVLKYYSMLGFDFFKLDFLYASNLKPLKGQTRAETTEFIYEIIRSELKDKIILGCGAILTNAAEKFDFCRIGPDVSLSFDDAAYMRMFHSERISTKVTIKNTIYRSILNDHFFMNDPDVFLLRDNIKLTSEQRIALAGINALFGSLLMTSDNIGEYSDRKKAALEHALNLFYNGEVTSFRRDGRFIDISYKLNGIPGSFRYDTVKGAIIRKHMEGIK